VTPYSEGGAIVDPAGSRDATRAFCGEPETP
jgi:hypothetical protein